MHIGEDIRYEPIPRRNPGELPEDVQVSVEPYPETAYEPEVYADAASSASVSPLSSD